MGSRGEQACGRAHLELHVAVGHLKQMGEPGLLHYRLSEGCRHCGAPDAKVARDAAHQVLGVVGRPEHPRGPERVVAVRLVVAVRRRIGGETGAERRVAVAARVGRRPVLALHDLLGTPVLAVRRLVGPADGVARARALLIASVKLQATGY